MAFSKWSTYVRAAFALPLLAGIMAAGMLDCGGGSGGGGGGGGGDAWTSEVIGAHLVCEQVPNLHYAVQRFPGGKITDIAYPPEIGDDIIPLALWFTDAEHGVALVADADGSTAHVLRYDPATIAWTQVHRFAQEEIGIITASNDTIQRAIRLDADGNIYVLAWWDNELDFEGNVARIDAQGKTVRKDVLFGGSLLSFDVVGTSPAAIFCAPSSYYPDCMRLDLATLAVEYTFQPWYASCGGDGDPSIPLPIEGVAPVATGAEAYLIRCNGAIIECHDRTCAPASRPSDCTRALSSPISRSGLAWANWPWGTVGQKGADAYPGRSLQLTEGEPVLDVYRCDQSDPPLRVVLPTASTELGFVAWGPDPLDRSALRLSLWDGDIEQGIVEFTIDPETGAAARAETAFATTEEQCWGLQLPDYNPDFQGTGNTAFVFYR